MGFSDNKIAAPTVPGADPNGKPPEGDATAEGKRTNEATATGGTKHNYFTITIKELIGLRANTVTGGKDTALQSGNGVADELLRVLAMATTATG